MSRLLKNIITPLVLIFSMGLVITPGALALDSKQKQLDVFRGTLVHLQQNYGMQDYKERHLGLNFEEITKLFSKMINEATTLEEVFGIAEKKDREILSLEEFEQLMIGLAAMYKDGHTNILRNSRNYYTLGLEASAIGERLYVTGFDAELFLPEASTHPVSVTDEITHINGIPVLKLARVNALYMPAATETNRVGTALKSLINVSHRFLPSKKEGENVELTFKQHPSRGGRTYTGSYYWINANELRDLKDDIRVVYPDRPAQGATEAEWIEYYAQVLKATSEAVEKYRAENADNENSNDDGLPLDLLAGERERLQNFIYGRSSTTDSYLYAGIMSLGLDPSKVRDIGILINDYLEKNGKNKVTRLRALQLDLRLSDLLPNAPEARVEVAYLRLPSYSPSSFDDVMTEIAWIQLAIRQMKSADVLIIDHTHNGGGYNYYGTQFLRQFVTMDPENPKDLEALRINLRINAQVLRTSRQWSDGVGFNGEVANFTRDFVNDSLHDEWEQKIRDGRGAAWSGPLPFMTPGLRNSTTLSSIFTPHHKWETYQGPIFFANDKGSASNGDFGAKIMQMNNRALIWGERSGGLGGPVWGSVDSIPGLYMYLRCTQGECLFPQGVAPIENVGVKPDIERGIRIEDLLDNFRSYARETLIGAMMHSGNVEKEKIAEAVENIRSTDRYVPDAIKQAIANLEEEIIKLNESVLPDISQPGSIQTYYGRLALLIKQAKSEADLEVHDFDNVGIIHPALALNQDYADVFLTDFTEALEISNRLREMLQMDKYQGIQAELKAMIQAYQATRDFQMLPFETAPRSCQSHFGI